MLNVLVALKIWAYCKVQIQCDNMAVVKVPASGKAKDKVLATCARNIPRRENTVADLLSRFKFDEESCLKLNQDITHPHWIPTHIDLTCLNCDI